MWFPLSNTNVAKQAMFLSVPLKCAACCVTTHREQFCYSDKQIMRIVDTIFYYFTVIITILSTKSSLIITKVWSSSLNCRL